jgi:hypothetical protein
MLLTYPIWLFALAAISIPIIIHLWNLKPGKTLKVGSIALFTASSLANSRSFKFQDILLLLLRCLLLVLLAFLLAAPLWQQHFKSSTNKGWLLLPQADAEETYHKFQPKIDSLLKESYETHFFQPGFDKQDLKELKTLTDTGKRSDTLNYWSLIKELAAKVSPATPIELFTPNSANHFRGERPTTSLHINWHTYTPTDSIANWLVAAWLMANGNIRVVQGISSPTGTSYQYRDIINGQSGAYQMEIDNGLPYVSFKGNKIALDTTIVRIAIYADRPIPDANYLKAALLAIQQLTGRYTVIKLYNNAAAIIAGQDWIYWLSEKAVDPSIRSKTKSLFAYETGKPTKTNSWLSNTEAHTLSQGEHKIALYKIIPIKKTLSNTVWADGYSNPVLSAEQTRDLTTYHFYSRFNPGWNDLVWQEEFTKWLLTLTQPVPESTVKNERRALSNAQIQPAFIDDKVYNQPNTHIDLSYYIWLVLAVAFAAERWLATKNKTGLVNG